jgi:hypothetical protein
MLYNPVRWSWYHAAMGVARYYEPRHKGGTTDRRSCTEPYFGQEAVWETHEQLMDWIR